jgi:hypothetical protein
MYDEPKVSAVSLPAYEHSERGSEVRVDDIFFYEVYILCYNTFIVSLSYCIFPSLYVYLSIYNTTLTPIY